MPSVSAIVIMLVALAVLGWVGWRDHARLRGSRRSLLDACATVLDEPALHFGGDGFPRLTGLYRGRRVDVRLITDTMTIRRLPQLWMQTTLIEPVAIEAGFAALVRPSGFEFYSLTGAYTHVIEPGPPLPREMIIRGETAGAEEAVGRALPALAAILVDPRNKEVAATAKGLRIIRQVGEGGRGDYLLLRQAVFADEPVAAEELSGLLAHLEALAASLAADRRKVEAA